MLCVLLWALEIADRSLYTAEEGLGFLHGVIVMQAGSSGLLLPRQLRPTDPTISPVYLFSLLI